MVEAPTPCTGGPQLRPRSPRLWAQPWLPVCGSGAGRRVSWVWAAPHLLWDGPVAAGLERAPWGLLKAVPSSPGAPSKGLFIPLSVFSAASVPESRPPRGGGSARPGPQRPLPATAACGDRPATRTGELPRPEPLALAGLAEGRVSRAAAAAALATKSTLAQEAPPVCVPGWPAWMGPQGPPHRPVQGRPLAWAMCCRPSAVGTGAWRTGPCLLGARRASAQAPQTRGGGGGGRALPSHRSLRDTSHVEGPWRSLI